MPVKKPPTAGSHSLWPSSRAMSIAGIKSDHTEAAIIMPDAKPISAFCVLSPSSRRMKNTIAAPNVVPISGRVSPSITLSVLPSMSLPPYDYALCLYMPCV